ncbi:MAG: toprim domain-containing protein [Prevotellaceae bacterium]|jgi:hypothetical protein|nr:toprim domain-containing protein [Prevotellaceae bacterium]
MENAKQSPPVPSVSFAELWHNARLQVIGSYKEKYCYLDNDKGGTSAYQEIQKKYGSNVLDRSIHYNEYKDLNDYLCGKKLLLKKQMRKGFKP